MEYQMICWTFVLMLRWGSFCPAYEFSGGVGTAPRLS